MHRFCVAIAAALSVFPLVCPGENVKIIPTTTLTAQTTNNTSAANGFVSQSNGNLGAANVSKVNLHWLLYPGASTKIYAHLMLWFGGENHMDVGYDSADPVQIRRQIEDMISRGIDGVIIDWYGRGHLSDQATQILMTEAEAHPGFSFAIMVDQGAIKSNSCQGCSPQQALIDHLQYAEQNYFASPAYMKIEGRPMVTNFDIDLYYSIDWKAVKAALTSDPAFLFQNKDGFSHVISDGSYSWVMPTQPNYGMDYLESFYATGKGFPELETVGAVYKGFDDRLAKWGKNRVMSQQCGQTWLQTFSKINSLYTTANPLSSLQLVTWNDYEEGTELESGIDNCVSVAASTSEKLLQWTVVGDENTIDHYTVYISTDGQALMPLAELATGSHSLNLCSYSLDVRKYTLYVQATGKPSLANHLSGPVSYTPNCGTKKPSILLGATPSNLTIASGQSGSAHVTVISEGGPLDQAVGLSCSGLPVGMTCSFDPAMVTPGEDAASSILTVSTVSVSANRGSSGSRQRQAPLWASVFTLGLVGIVLSGQIGRRTIQRALCIGLLFGVTILFDSCGGTRSAAAMGVPAGTYCIVISGSSGSVQASTPATVQVR